MVDMLEGALGACVPRRGQARQGRVIGLSGIDNDGRGRILVARMHTQQHRRDFLLRETEICLMPSDRQRLPFPFDEPTFFSSSATLRLTPPYLLRTVCLFHLPTSLSNLLLLACLLSDRHAISSFTAAPTCGTPLSRPQHPSAGRTIFHLPHHALPRSLRLRLRREFTVCLAGSIVRSDQDFPNHGTYTPRILILSSRPR